MIRVLIVDDSAVVRKVLTEELAKGGDIEVVGTATDPYAAREKIAQLRPDVVTLDLEMPRMDGLSFLAKLMKHYPLPVVVVSSLTPKNSETAIRAMELGAVEVISKPGSTYSTPDNKMLLRAIRSAASARIIKRQSVEAEVTPSLAKLHLNTTHKVIAIGASTGGTQAIEVLLKGMPINSPGMLIAQHMPEFFTASFAARLNSICQIEVREAADRDDVLPGLALIAPGNKHMVLQRSGTRYYVAIKDGPAVNHQRPSVDVLFQSVALNAGSNAIGVILTGMGADGAKGLAAVHTNGAYTIAQDEQTCVVFGMPKEAIRLGAVDRIVPIQNVSQTIIDSYNVQKNSLAASAA